MGGKITEQNPQFGEQPQNLITHL